MKLELAQQLDVTLADHTLTLLADRAAWWPAERTLLIADAHFGKAAAFRAAGIAAPEAATHDLGRLDALLEATAAERLIILGDLLHAATGRTEAVLDPLRDWRNGRRSLAVALVRGNHDRAAGDPPADLRIDCLDEPADLSGLSLAHDLAMAPAGAPAVGGHTHPAAALRDLGRTPLRLPCFILRDGHLTLPAFSSFTGMKGVRAGSGGLRVAVTPQGLLRMPG